MISVLSRMLTTQRYRPKAANVGHATPMLHEVTLGAETLPLMVTNARMQFVPTKLSQQSIARAGFSEVPIDKEPELFEQLLTALFRHYHQGQPLAQGLAAACKKLQAAKMLPATVVASVTSVAKRSGLAEEEVRKLQELQGYVVQQGSTQMLALDLPDRMLVVLASPPELGIQVRVGDHVAVMIHRANAAVVMAVDDGLDR